MRVLIVILVVAVVLSLAGVFAGPVAYRAIKAHMPDGEQTLVRMENPIQGELIEKVQAPGNIVPKTKVEISSRIAARIVALPFKEGDRVTKGDPDATPPVSPSLLIKLDSSDLKASLEAATARRAADAASIEVAKARIESEQMSLTGVEASLKQARQDLDRNKNLLQTSDVPQSTVDQLVSQVAQLTSQLASQKESLKADQLNLDVMKHNLDASDAEIDQAREAMSYTEIYSPIDGIITRINAEVGELVMTGTMNNAGTVIMQVADLDTMLLEAEVDEADVGKVAVGQSAKVRINAYPGRIFTGKVDSISLVNDVAQDGSKYYKTDILVDTQGTRIYSGLTADVEIETKRHENAMMVPSQAVLARPLDDIPILVRDNNPDIDKTKSTATVVFRVINGKAVITPVTIGASDISNTLILSGLSPKDKVIVGPYRVFEKLKDDQSVKDERVAEQEKLDKERQEEQHKQEQKDSGAEGKTVSSSESSSPSSSSPPHSTTGAAAKKDKNGQ